MKKYCLFLAVLFYFSLAIGGDPDWKFKSVKENYSASTYSNSPINTEIEFLNGHKAKTRVIEFKLIDFLTSETGDTFILFTGRTCTECDMNTSIYIKPASDDEYDLKRFGFPGKLKSYLDGSPVEDTRLFYGNCLNDGEVTVIFYSHYLGNDGKWHKSVYDVDFLDNRVIQNSTEIPYENVTVSEKLVKKGNCYEIYGRDGYTEP